jgi:hypothetical protein
LKFLFSHLFSFLDFQFSRRRKMMTQKDLDQTSAQAASQDDTLKDASERLPHYDAHLIPAETVAREAREGSDFCHVDHDDPKNTEHIHTRDGYTIDQEGLINNYAVEVPMYVNEPGDLAKE